MDMDPANLTQPIRKRRETVRVIRRSIGWIDTALSRLRGTGSKRRTRKRAFLIAKLKRLFGQAKLNTKRRPQSLMQKTPMQEVPPEMIPGIESFWKGVCEVEGTYHPRHEAIASWTREIREQTRPDPDDNPPLNQERAWEMATKKNWTAPGPNGIPGYWLKKFKRPDQALALEGVGWRDRNTGLAGKRKNSPASKGWM